MSNPSFSISSSNWFHRSIYHTRSILSILFLCPILNVDYIRLRTRKRESTLMFGLLDTYFLYYLLPSLPPPLSATVNCLELPNSERARSEIQFFFSVSSVCCYGLIEIFFLVCYRNLLFIFIYKILYQALVKGNYTKVLYIYRNSSLI